MLVVIVKRRPFSSAKKCCDLIRVNPRSFAATEEPCPGRLILVEGACPYGRCWSFVLMEGAGPRFHFAGSPAHRVLSQPISKFEVQNLLSSPLTLTVARKSLIPFEIEICRTCPVYPPQLAILKVGAYVPRKRHRCAMPFFLTLFHNRNDRDLRCRAM